MDDALWLSCLEDLAREALPPPVFEYVVQGARDGDTARRAIETWRGFDLHPRVLQDVRVVDPGIDLLGHRHSLPFGVAPTTLQRAIHPEGEIAMARAVASRDGLLVVSSNSGTPFDRIGATSVHWWVQCYLPADRNLALPLLGRAVEAGATAVVLTLDTPVVGTKYHSGESVWTLTDPNMVRVNFDAGYDGAPGADKARDLGAEDVGWLADQTGLPVVLKGVLRADDAAACVDAGAAALWVSNHGGRQLDRARSTASALPDVVGAAGGLPVLVDGGVRTGLDVVTALALGADAVFLGRLPLYALVHGETGVTRMLVELGLQVEEAMRLLGSRSVLETRGHAVRRAPTAR